MPATIEVFASKNTNPEKTIYGIPWTHLYLRVNKEFDIYSNAPDFTDSFIFTAYPSKPHHTQLSDIWTYGATESGHIAAIKYIDYTATHESYWSDESVVVFEGANAEMLARASDMEFQHTIINDVKYPYNFMHQNSNTYVTSLLEEASIDFTLPESFGWAPAFGEELTNQPGGWINLFVDILESAFNYFVSIGQSLIDVISDYASSVREWFSRIAEDEQIDPTEVADTANFMLDMLLDFEKGYDVVTNIGTSGHDILNHSTGNDWLLGGAGDDVFNVGVNSIDTLIGGEGIDTADFSSLTEGVDVRLDTGFSRSLTNNIRNDIFEIENVVGTDFDDYIWASEGANTLTGGKGSDDLYGLGGADTFLHNAGDGNDFLYSGEYNSSDVVTMFNQNGDLLLEEDIQFIVTGRDLILKNRDTGEELRLDDVYFSTGKTFASVNDIDITGGLNIIGTGNTENIDGTDYGDTLEGGLGSDYIYGEQGADLFVHHQGDGNDYFFSGEYNSADSIQMYDASGNLLSEIDLQFVVSGHDLKIINRNSDEIITLDNQYYSTGNTFSNVNGIDLTGAINFVGNENTEVIHATEHNDTIQSGLGNDTVYGKSGDDIYIHHFGDGNDHYISGEYNSSDSVFMYDSLGGLIAEEDLLFSVYAYDLRVEERVSGEFVILDNMYFSTGFTFATVNGIDMTGGLNIVATDDAETFYGTDFDDTLEGGGGDDIIYGQGGNDTYIHHRGDGNDHLLSGEYDSLDKIYMYDDNNTLIPEIDLRFIVNNRDLIVEDRVTGEHLTLDNLYYSTGDTFATINGIDLSGGVNSVGTSAGETIYGTDENDTLEGAEGTDIIHGEDGDDIFIHHQGDGNDYLYSGEYNSNDDIFMFDDTGVEISEIDLMFSQQGYDMVVTHTETTETLVLDNFFRSTGSTFDSLNGIDLDLVVI